MQRTSRKNVPDARGGSGANFFHAALKKAQYALDDVRLDRAGDFLLEAFGQLTAMLKAGGGSEARRASLAQLLGEVKRLPGKLDSAAPSAAPSPDAPGDAPRSAIAQAPRSAHSSVEAVAPAPVKALASPTTKASPQRHAAADGDAAPPPTAGARLQQVEAELAASACHVAALHAQLEAAHRMCQRLEAALLEAQLGAPVSAAAVLPTVQAGALATAPIAVTTSSGSECTLEAAAGALDAAACAVTDKFVAMQARRSTVLLQRFAGANRAARQVQSEAAGLATTGRQLDGLGRALMAAHKVQAVALLRLLALMHAEEQTPKGDSGGSSGGHGDPVWLRPAAEPHRHASAECFIDAMVELVDNSLDDAVRLARSVRF